MLDQAQVLDTPHWVIAVLGLLVFALVVNDACLGHRAYAKFIRTVTAAPAERVPQLRARFLLNWAWQPWVLTVIAIAFVSLAPGIELRNIGFAWPDFSGIILVIADGGVLGGGLLGMLVGVGILLLVILFTPLFKSGHQPGARWVNSKLSAMLPTAKEDQRAWLLLSTTAATTEEVMYRGLVLITLTLLLPSAPDILLYVLAVVCFAVAHIYQGWGGVITTGLLGAMFLALLVATGSLLPGIMLHFIVDARAAIFTPAASGKR
ncbi:MAG: CPBP family intramembrane glutamic endopeptidase [Leucobacter sp.]